MAESEGATRPEKEYAAVCPKSQAAVNAYSHAYHVARAIHPAASKLKLLLMLRLAYTGYFDETGHIDDPNVRYMGIAGFVAPARKWQIFESRWKSALKEAGLSEPFHMKDFAHSTWQFKSWKGNESKRQKLMAELLRVIRKAGATPVGAIVSSQDFKSLTRSQRRLIGGPEEDPYFLCFQVCAKGAALEAEGAPSDEKVAVVFAHNPESSSKSRRLWEVMVSDPNANYTARLGSYAVSTPELMVQLQAADLAAYELFHEFDGLLRRPGSAMRWPMKEILKMANIPLPRIRLFDRFELLRILAESGCPDQTGMSELRNNQDISAMLRMINRVTSRSGIWK